MDEIMSHHKAPQAVVKLWLKLAMALAISTQLLSCASPVKKTETAENLLQSALDANAEQVPAVPPSVSASLLAAGDTGNVTTREERFDVGVNSVAAKVFFLSLVNGTSTNLVVHPDVEGNISLELKDVSVRDVLNVTRRIYGYEYTLDDGIYTILPRTLRTEVFPINYLDVIRKGSSDTNIVVGNISSNSNRGNNRGNNGGNSNDDNSGNGGGGQNGSQQSSSSGTRVQTSSDADFWQSLEHSLHAIVGVDKGDRMVMVNGQTGIVVVRAMPAELASVREFLEKSQLSAGRQVVLETKIIEVQLNDGFETGVDWSVIEGQLSGSFERIRNQSTSTLTSTVSSVSAVLGVTDITKLLSLLETQGQVQILSSPRVSTVNNQKAVIRVGSDEFFVTGISNSTTSSAATTTNTPTVELSSFFSGIALDVTPQIADNGDVILHVHPVISDVTDQLKELTVGSDQFSLPLALRDIRESDSIVRAKNGQVIVLGGLMQEISSRNRIDRPGLSKIPVLNWFFKRKNDAARKTELVILMRPVVTNDDVWRQDINSSQQRIMELKRDF